MHIRSHTPSTPQRLNTPTPPQPPAPEAPNPEPPQKPHESAGRKATRVVAGTLIGAATGYVGGHFAQQGGMAGTLGTVYLGVSGAGSGASIGWNGGKRLGLALAGSQGNEYARGIGALTLTFGGPLVGGVAGLAVGVAAATGGPIAAAGVMGGLSLARELLK